MEMNPLLRSALFSIARWALAIVAGWFVRKGIVTDANATEYVAAGAMALVSLAWSIWKNRQHLIEKMTALALPRGSTPRDLKMVMASGCTADPSTGPDQAPEIPLPDKGAGAL